jgi:hypothetical protein
MRNKWIRLAGLSAVSLSLTSAISFAGGQYGPGVSDTEIKIGNTMAYSGPASSYGTIRCLGDERNGLAGSPSFGEAAVKNGRRVRTYLPAALYPAAELRRHYFPDD